MENTVQGFLDYATKCKTEPDTITLLTALKQRFLDEPGLAWLDIANDEYCIEDGQPYVRFELNRVISEHYITTVRPEIRFGEMRVSVITNRMRDGRGMQSHSWEVAHGLEEDMLLESAMSMEALALRAKRIAIEQHVSLLEMLGVPRAEAQEMASKLWKAAA